MSAERRRSLRICTTIARDCAAIAEGGIGVATPKNYESQPGTAPDARYLDWWIVSQSAGPPGCDDRRNLQFVLGAVLAGLWEVDFASERVTWSPEMYWLHGWDAMPRRISAYLNQMVHPDDRSLMRSVLVNMVAGVDSRRPIDVEYRIIRPDGAIVWVSAVGSMELGEDGRPKRSVGISRDISQRKRAELAQHEADRLIARIAEVAPTLIYVYDFETNRRVYNNGWLPELLGYGGNQDVDVKEFMDRVVHPDDLERLAAYRRTHPKLPDGVISQVEYRARHSDGSWRWMLSRNQVFVRSADGTVRQLIGTTTDITAAKRNEEELRRLNVELERRVSERTADLEAANRELDAFAYSVSHDLRGPLRAIGGFNSAVLETHGEQLGEEGQRYLSLVGANVKRMADMIEGLLALSRTTRSDMLVGAVDLSVIAAEVLADLRHWEPKRQVDVVIAPHLAVTGDARLLRVALDNLIGNAWKYTSRCEHARIEFGVQVVRHESIYFVKDNGAGFDMAHAAALFVPFQRLHTAGEFDGTGVGLATVQRIIHRHGGRIWAQSAPNEGATFYFTLGGDSPE